MSSEMYAENRCRLARMAKHAQRGTPERNGGTGSPPATETLLLECCCLCTWGQRRGKDQVFCLLSPSLSPASRVSQTLSVNGVHTAV